MGFGSTSFINIRSLIIYKTSDLYLASFLRAKGHKVTCKKATKCTFVFLDDVKDDVNAFFNDGEISVTRYKNAIQDMKTLIYSA